MGGAGSVGVAAPGDGVAVEPVGVDAAADAGHVAGAGVLPCGGERTMNEPHIVIIEYSDGRFHYRYSCGYDTGDPTAIQTHAQGDEP